MTTLRSPAQPERVLSLIRLAALPVIFAGERLVSHPEAYSGAFGPILAAAVVYAVAAFGLTHSRAAARIPGWPYAAIDLAFICALTYTSGGPVSQLRYAFFLLPLGAALLLRPRLTAVASVASVLVYLAMALLHPATSGRLVDFEITQSLALGWMGFAATLLSRLLWSRAEEVNALAASRGRLVAQALDAEDRERRRLAEALHDEALQNLLAARQELAALNGDGPGLELVRVGLDRTIEQLRDAVFDLHPYVLEHGGLSAALQAVAGLQAHRAGYRFRIDVDPAATGVHDELLFSLARELITNATKHARARTLTVSVRRVEHEIVLDVADDGRGVERDRLAAARSSGHIGLASCAERVTAVAGRFEISAEPGAGTRVRAALPVAPSHAARSRPRGRQP